jgi:hypothetical protein
MGAQKAMRRAAAEESVLVAMAQGTTAETLARHLPAAEALVRSFDGAFLMRMSEPGDWRTWNLDTRSIPFLTRRSIRLHVSRTDEFARNDGDRDDVVSITGENPEGRVRIRVARIGDLLWSMMPRREVVRSAGMLAASALGALRSCVSGEGLIPMTDARESSRLASLHHHRERVSDTPDLSMLGEPRHVSTFEIVWSIAAEADGFVVMPVIEMADPDEVGIVDLMRMTAGTARVDEAAVRRRVVNGAQS